MAKKGTKGKEKVDVEEIQLEDVAPAAEGASSSSSSSAPNQPSTPSTPMHFDTKRMSSSLALGNMGMSGTDLSHLLPQQMEKEETAEEDESESDEQYLNPNLEVPEIDEPVHGNYPEGFDVESFNKKRYGFKFRQYRPSLFDRSVPPMRLPTQIPVAERLLDIQYITTCPAEMIHLVCFANLQLPRKMLRSLPKLLNHFVNCEVLIVRDSGLSQVEKIDLPMLRLLDLANNNIQDIGQVTSLVKHSPNIEILDVSGNAVCNKANLKWKVIAELRYINVYNTKQVSPSDKAYAFDQYGSRKVRKANPQMKWDFTFCSLEPVRKMQMWNPEVIKQLYFPNMSLDSFSVGTFINLEELDLSNNEIVTLEGAGLERCNLLNYLNVGNNKIKKKDNLDVLQYIPSLRRLVLDGNPLKGYRSQVLYMTRKLLGTNRQAGLQELDGVHITIEDQLRALAAHDKSALNEIPQLRWKANMVQQFGSYQLHEMPGFSATVQLIRMPQRGLDFADVSFFPNLRVLDLSNNQLSHVTGLDNCLELRYLDISGNAKVNVKSVVKQLEKHQALQHILITVRSSKSIHEPSKKESKKLASEITANRKLVMENLFFNNPGLRRIDGTIINMTEMVNAYASVESNASKVEEYRFNLALTINCTQPANRMYHFSSVGIGQQYDPQTVKSLAKLNNLNLSSATVNFAPFTNLRTINMKGNKNVLTLNSMALLELPDLRYIDVRNCGINDSLSEIASLLDRMAKLNTIMLMGNPCMGKNYSKSRSIIIGAMETMHNVTCELRVIDEEVTISERIKAWKKQGASDKEAEELRWQATLYMVRPRDENGDLLPDDQVLGLDLNKKELATMDVTPFVNLQKLLLRDNEIRKVDHIVGLAACKKLLVLDLRNNKMQRMADVAEIIDNLPELRNLGLDGNRFAGKNYRSHLLRDVSSLHELDCKLQSLDETEIEIDEIVDAWAASGGGHQEREIFRFRKNLMRRTPVEMVAAELTELDMSGTKLEYLDFSELVNIKKLSLANNRLVTKSLETGGLDKLTELQAIDLSNNRIQSIGYVQQLVNKHWTKLAAIYLENNSCFPSNNNDNRVGFLRGLEQMKYCSATLKILNGDLITVNERCEANPRNLKYKELERFRFALSVEQIGPDREAEQIMLNGFGLREVRDVVSFSHLKALDLSHNNLEAVSTQHFADLKQLVVLNLSYNNLQDDKEAIDGLSYCWRLQQLWLTHAFGSNTKYHTPGNYVDEVCNELRGLKHLDEVENPNPLSDDQKTVIRWFRKKAPGAVNPNRLFSVDLSNQGLQEDDFQQVLAGLTALPIRTLRTKENPMFKPTNRLLILYLVNFGGLHMLDDEEVTEAEVANAVKKYSKEKEELNSKFDPKTLNSAHSASRTHRAKSMGEKASNIATLADEGVVVKATGSILTKSEILVNFFQIFGLLFLFVPQVAWPKIFIDWTFWTFAFTIDFDLLIPFQIPVDWQWAKFGLFMGVPLLLFLIYNINPNEDKWRAMFVENWGATRSTHQCLLLAWLLVSLAAGFFLFMDQNLAHPTYLDTNGFSLFVAMGGVGLIVYLVWYFNARAYIKSVERKDDEYFFNYKKTKKRICLFALTVMYMPIVKTVLMNFKCADNGAGLERWPALPCVTGTQDLALIHYLSIFFGLLYSLGIPLFFARLIAKGVSDIDRSYKFTEKKKRIEEKRQEMKDNKDASRRKELKKEVEDMEEDFTREYAFQTKRWSSAQAYLYMPYERHFRFYKIFQMLEKGLLLAMSIFLVGSAAVFAGEAVLGAFSLLAYVSRPFSDDLEDYMDIVSRTTNLVNMTLGLFITLDASAPLDWFRAYITPYLELILFAVNGFQVVFALFSFLAQPIRAWVANQELFQAARRAAKAGARAAAEAAEKAAEAAKEAAQSTEAGEQAVETAEHVRDAAKQALPGQDELEGVDASANVLNQVDYGDVANEVNAAAGVAGAEISERTRAALEAAPGAAAGAANAARDAGRSAAGAASAALQGRTGYDVDVGAGVGAAANRMAAAAGDTTQERLTTAGGMVAGAVAAKKTQNKYAKKDDESSDEDYDGDARELAHKIEMMYAEEDDWDSSEEEESD